MSNTCVVRIIFTTFSKMYMYVKTYIKLDFVALWVFKTKRRKTINTITMRKGIFAPLQRKLQ